MRYRSLDDIYVLMDAAQASFTATVSGVTEAQANLRPEGGGWTIAEIAEHVGLTNTGFLRITHKLLKQAEASGAPPLGELNLAPVIVREEDGTPLPAFAAPDRVKPQGQQALSVSLTTLAEALAGFHAVRPRLSATDCSNETFPHPAVGELNAYQWMIVLGEHLDRHRGQIERIQMR